MKAILLVLLLLATGCGVDVDTAAPRCGDVERLGVVAQAVPASSYVPCLRDLPVGWRATGFEVGPGASRISLLSDRSGGRPVDVVLEPRCDVGGASPARPRAEGVRSFLRLDSIAPLYAGTAYDVFPGGCLRSSFAFPRGPHIPLMEELRGSVDLVPRRELRLQVRDRLGVELDP